MKKEVEIAKTNPNESKLKKAAKEFGKYLTSAALTAALTLNPLSFGVGKKELIREKPSIELVKKAYAEEKEEELPVLPLSGVLAMREKTEQLIKEGKVEEVKFEPGLVDLIILNKDNIKEGDVDLKISKKPEVIIVGYGENDLGKFIAVLVFDEDIKNKTNETAKLMVVRIYPKPNKPLTPDAQTGRGIILAKINLAE